jgi:hypothetical protein
MTEAEFHAWRQFHVAYPFDDLHRYHRPAALIARSQFGGEVQPFIDWLSPDPANSGMDDADLKTMRAFGFARKGELRE